MGLALLRTQYDASVRSEIAPSTGATIRNGPRTAVAAAIAETPPATKVRRAASVWTFAQFPWKTPTRKAPRPYRPSGTVIGQTKAARPSIAAAASTSRPVASTTRSKIVAEGWTIILFGGRDAPRSPIEFRAVL